MCSLFATATPSEGMPSTWGFSSTLSAAALLALALVVAGCGGAGANEDGGGNDGGGDDGGGGGDGTGLSAPAAPSGLSAAPEDGAAQLSWDTVDDADTYQVYRDTSSGVDASSSALDTGVGQSSYTDETAENGTEYFYVVTAVASEDGESAESDPSREASAVPVAAPSGLEGTSRDSEVGLSWQAAAGAETYSVYRSTSSAEGDPPEGDPLATGVGETSYADTTARNGTKYYYRVTSVNPSGAESSASGEVEKTPFSDPPDRP
jgi:fibronectin type 3 domain-containing protein